MSETIETGLKEILKQYVDSDYVDNIDLDEDMGKLGINSLRFIKLVVILENEYNIKFENEDLDFSRFRTLRDLISHIEELRKC